MNPLQAIEALSSALGVRIRLARQPDYFEFLAGFIERLDMNSIVERIRITGIDADDAVYRIDSQGRITALYLPSSEGLDDTTLAPIVALADLELLALNDFAAPLAAVRRIATLPRLRLLAIGAAADASNALASLCETGTLEGLWLESREDELDLAPLVRLPRLRAFGCLGVRRPVHAEALADCPQLRHLAMNGIAFNAAAALRPLDRLEALHVDGNADFLNLDLLAGLGALRSLALEGTQVPAAALAPLRGLRALSLADPQASLHALPDLPLLEVLQLRDSATDDLAPVHRFPRLRHLSLVDGQVNDLRPLDGLAGLEFLDLSGNLGARHRKPLSLPGLRQLHWTSHSARGRLHDASLFARCTALEVVSLQDHHLDDLSFVASMGRLRVLDLAENDITDLAPLAGLPMLEQLDLSGSSVRSVAPLARCTTLTRLNLDRNPVEDLAAVGALERLESLRMQHLGATDLGFTKRLRNLFELDASNNGIAAIEPLLELPHLGRVDLSGNAIGHLTRELIEGLAGLESLKLSSNPIEGLDAELYAGGDGRKVLQSLRDYFASLNRGAVRHDQAKLLLVGNGRVGKTSLVARLLDDSFDPAQPSTHAIQLRVWPLHHVADDKLHGRPLRVNVWDFGGQDIYHATHRLFMRTRALFLLVWDRQTEHQQYSLDESGERYENFSLAYWLDYVHALSGSPVLVVQNKVDSLADKDPAYGTELLAAYPPPGGIVDFLHVSARRDADPGMAVLVARIRESLASMSAVGHFLPAQWVAVRDRLAGLGRHTLARADFDALCVEAGLQGSQPESLVRFLHESGALFYQPGQFGELLILDQRWAIDAVYALLDRRGAAYRSLRAAGRNGLTLDLLRNQVWRHVAADEHALLLDFMARCELCFELGQGRWYVPQLLPDEMPSRVARRWAEAPPHALQIRYRFLHRAIVDRFLVRAGRLGADDEPEIWRNGIVVLDASGDAEALVAADAAGGCIVARGRGPGGVALLCAVKREFDQLHQPFEARCFVSADQGQDWVDLAMLERHARAGLGAVLSEALRPVPVASLADFVGGAAAASGGLRAGLFSVSAKSAITARRDPARPEIFVSYAWGDADETGESREAIVDRLHDRLVAIGYRVVRDKKDAGYRSNISEFMQRIGHGELVVAVISYKYLRSPYCMYELLEIYRQGRFSERVFPIVLDDARIHTMDEMLDCFRFWQDEKQRIEAKIDAIGWRNLSVDGFFKDYERYYRTVFNHLDLLLTLIKDWNALTPKRLEENSFERLIGAIQAQMAQPG